MYRIFHSILFCFLLSGELTKSVRGMKIGRSASKSSTSDIIIQIDSTDKNDLTSAERMDIEAAFKIYDKDNNGVISPEELYDVLKGIGDKSSLKEAQDMIKGVDQNGDGVIDLNEFIDMMTKGNRNDDGEIRQIFDRFDADGNDYISKDELKNSLGATMGVEYTDEELDELIGEFDTDGDGKISFEEFKPIIKIKNN